MLMPEPSSVLRLPSPSDDTMLRRSVCMDMKLLTGFFLKSSSEVFPISSFISVKNFS